MHPPSIITALANLKPTSGGGGAVHMLLRLLIRACLDDEFGNIVIKQG
jgi:hypothetical protein